jgi:hypothetical protein
LKQSAEEGEEFETLAGENEILRSKICELENSVNTLSRNDDDSKMKDRLMYDRTLTESGAENARLTEQCRIMVSEVRLMATELTQQGENFDEKERQLNKLQKQFTSLQGENLEIARQN